MASEYNRRWILENGIPVVQSYGGNLTLRALHYRLVAKGMTNDLQHYRKVVQAMIEARWSGDVAFDDFKDHERSTIGKTEYEETILEDEVEQMKSTIRYWMNRYNKNRWENQPNYVEVFIEKKALQGVFEGPCDDNDVALNPCKGYPSLTYLNDAVTRFNNAYHAGKNCKILYFGDYDPSGEDIPRSIEDNLRRMGFYDFELIRYALLENQVIEMNLPPAPVKRGDARSATWDGLGQVELDAIEPRQLARMAQDAIDEHFDYDLYEELMDQEEEERQQYRADMKEFVKSL